MGDKGQKLQKYNTPLPKSSFIILKESKKKKKKKKDNGMKSDRQESKECKNLGDEEAQFKTPP